MRSCGKRKNTLNVRREKESRRTEPTRKNRNGSKVSQSVLGDKCIYTDSHTDEEKAAARKEKEEVRARKDEEKRIAKDDKRKSREHKREDLGEAGEVTAAGAATQTTAVSYTHLTLPTKRIV